MENFILGIFGLLLIYTPFVSAYINCGFHICYGSDAYCCHLDDGTTGCCWETYVYELWWFWLIWIVVFFLILACGLACWRRRRARYRYVVMANSEYPSYGTVVATNTTSTVYSAQPVYGAQSLYNPPYGSATTAYPNAPVAPPSYETAEATKPPAYSN